MEVFLGILIPFLGTTLGAACVFLMRRAPEGTVQRALNGFAAGVMTAAAVWSLLLPAIREAAYMGNWAFVPAVAGLWIGFLFLRLIDAVLPLLHRCEQAAAHTGGKLRRTAMLVLTVTLHNIPEGMAVGAVYAGYLAGDGQITAAGALALSVGIAVQNFPEGAIVSLPLHAAGKRRWRAFLGGTASGAVEPLGAILTILAARAVVPALPYFLSFAAGAMLSVVIQELIPEAVGGTRRQNGVLCFALGFSLMMILDVALG